MANVYTKKCNRARTTTLRDFTYKTEKLTLPRILSPTRRINPHPQGLVRQSPYNKDNTAFDIWKPSPISTKTTFPLMIDHLGRVNFSCGPVDRLLNAHAPKGIPPEIEYSMDSISRISYCNPQYEVFRRWKGKQKTSRFGHTPDFTAARGIVPSLVVPCYPLVPED